MFSTEKGPSLLDIHQREPQSLVGYPLDGIVTIQSMMSSDQTHTAINGLLSAVDILTAGQANGTPDDYVGTGILYHCVMNPMQVATIPGKNRADSIRFMLEDIKNFADFVAKRFDPATRFQSWSPRFHFDSPIYVTNILPPIEDNPQAYKDFQWSVLRYRTAVPGIYLEVAEELGVSFEGNWVFPNGSYVKYVLNEDEL